MSQALVMSQAITMFYFLQELGHRSHPNKLVIGSDEQQFFYSKVQHVGE